MDRFVERFLHVDMDAFYVEVERLYDLSLRHVPVVIGGLGARGVVAAASYEARTYGIHSAMPMAEARRRHPGARFVPPSHRRYGEMSDRVFAILRSFTPLVEGLSVDEAFLDVAGLRLHFGSPEEVGQAIRARLRGDLGMPASVGIATTKFLAKLGSEDAKPDGLVLVPTGTELDYLHPLSVRRLWGVGEATHAALEGLAIETIGDLAAVPLRLLEERLGRALSLHLSALAAGRDDREIVVGAASRSVSVEETYEHDLVDRETIERELLSLCGRLSGRLQRSGHAGRTVTLKVRFGDFTTVSRSVTASAAIEHTPALWDAARALLGRARPAGRGVRLLGIGVSGLEAGGSPRQLSLESPPREAAAVAAEEVRARFGDEAVVPARLAQAPRRPASREDARE